MKQPDLMPLDLFRLKTDVDTLFRSDQFFRMELIMLEKLDWDVSITTSHEVASLLIRSHFTLSEIDSLGLTKQLRSVMLGLQQHSNSILQSNPLSKALLVSSILVERRYGEEVNSTFLTEVSKLVDNKKIFLEFIHLRQEEATMLLKSLGLSDDLSSTSFFQELIG